MNTPDPTPQPRPITDEERAKRAERARKAREAKALKAQTVVSSGKRVDAKATLAQDAPAPAPAGKVHVAHGRKLKIVVPRRRVVPVRSGGFTMRG